MHLSDQDELLVQRCVDDELNKSETLALLSTLDSTSDGWKALACAFLEDRVLTRALSRTAVGDGSVSSDDPQITVARRPHAAGQTSRSRTGWFAHPLTSMTLCAAIAFVSGLLIPGPSDIGSPPSATSVTQAPAGTAAAPSAIPAVTAERNAAATDPLYHVQWAPEGSDRQVMVPVYQKPDEWVQEMGGQWQLFGQDNADLSSLGGPAATRLIRIPMNDSEDILLFVREQDLGLPLQ